MKEHNRTEQSKYYLLKRKFYLKLMLPTLIIVFSSLIGVFVAIYYEYYILSIISCSLFWVSYFMLYFVDKIIEKELSEFDNNLKSI